MTILVGFIPTPEGDAAFTAGLDEARRRGESVIVLNAAHKGQLVDDAAAPGDLLGHLAERGRSAGVHVETRHEGYDGELADEVDASVIVLGLRRRSLVGKLLMGSSAQRIIVESERPVLTVKADTKAR